MSKIKVEQELWDLAHDLEQDAIKQRDIRAMNKAAEWKGKLTMAIMNDKPVEKPQPSGIVQGKGVMDSLASVAATLEEIGVSNNKGVGKSE